MLSLVTDGAKVLNVHFSFVRRSAGAATLLLALLLSSCGFGGDSYDQWEAAETEYFSSLGDHRLDFPDDAHALAFALATDCFEELPATSELETAVQNACVTLEGDLSDLMTMDGLCEWLNQEENVGAERLNDGQLCG